MANLPQEFRTKFNLLERKFAVSSFIFKKYQEIFVEIFQEPGNEEVYQHKSKKPRYVTFIHEIADIIAFINNL